MMNEPNASFGPLWVTKYIYTYIFIKVMRDSLDFSNVLWTAFKAVPEHRHY